MFANLKLQFYPEKVTKALISYLHAICYGNPKNAVLDITVNWFRIKLCNICIIS